MIELIVEVKDGRISPKGSDDAEKLDGGDGTYTARLTGSKRRSLSQLALYWLACEMIADNLDTPEKIRKEDIDYTLKIEAGHAAIVKFHDGRYRYLPKSIAFNKLGSADFSRYMDEAFACASNIFGPALTEAVRAEFAALIKGDPHVAS